MKKKAKLKLDEIKVESFITSSIFESAQGGNTWGGASCQTGGPCGGTGACNTVGCPWSTDTCSACPGSPTYAYPC